MHSLRDGPDVPDRLIQAHEDSNVVFFCGAEISRPAGLPGFPGLASKLCSRFPHAASVDAALAAEQYDTAIGLLELEVPRDKVRSEAARLLALPTQLGPDALANHNALPLLAKNREGRLRLVTTNFNRLFETALAGRPAARCCAPSLPPPKARQVLSE